MEEERANHTFALKEPLKLADLVEVPDSIVQFLTCHQLDGIRFIHRGLTQCEGVILNDESGLGKTYQVVGYLAAVIKSPDKSSIVCSSLQRVHHWMYHLELLTKFKVAVLDGDAELHENHQIILSTFDYFQKQSDFLLSKKDDIKYLVVDETQGRYLELSWLALIHKFGSSKTIFLATDNLLEDWDRFSLRLMVCQDQFFKEKLRAFFEQATSARRSPSKAQKLKLFFLTRNVFLRRYRSHYKKDLPLVEQREFQSYFAAWKIAAGLNSQFESDDSPIVVEQIKSAGKEAAVIMKGNCDRLFDFDIGSKSTELEAHDQDQEVDGETSLNRAIIGDVGNVSLEREMSQETDSDKDDTVVSVGKKTSEPLFDFEQSTEDMPKLEVESSDSETKSTIGDARESCLKAAEPQPRTENTNIEVPETERESLIPEQPMDSDEYLEFGQPLVRANTESGSSTETVIQKAEASLTEEKYNFPIDRLLTGKSPSASSTDVEIVSKESVTNHPILVSSSSSNGAGREKSPDMFTDTDDEIDETVKNSSQDSLFDLLLKSPVEIDKPALPAAPPTRQKFVHRNVSTPISKLMYGPLQVEPEVSASNASSKDIFADITKGVDPNRTENVFEITDNNAFGNKIQVHVERESMSPLRDSDEVQFVSVIRNADDPIEIVDLDTEVCTPKSQTGRVSRASKKTPSTTGSVPSTPRGWLTKSSRHSSSDGGSPKTPTSSKKSTGGRRGSDGRCNSSTCLKRKKLENWFQDDDTLPDGEHASTSVNRRKSAPASTGRSSKRPSPRKKCFQERIIQRYNQILVSPNGFDSDFE